MALVLRNNRQFALKEYALEQTKDSIAWLRDYITAIKSGRFHPFTPLERKAREATRNEAWGPTGTVLNELADATFEPTSCEIIYAVLEFRLGYPNNKWRNVYKALTVLEFVVKRGSEQAVENAQNMLSKLSDLQVFEYTSPDGRDHGINVRHRAQAISVLLKDTARLQQERTAFASKRKVYKGFSNEQIGKDALQRRHSADYMERQFSFGNRANQGSSGSAAQPTSIIPPTARNAGEMKGVTMEQNIQQLAALKKLLDLPHNKQCADCVGGGGAARASWASINTGVFICMRCAGIHRGLGVHVSKVRSCTLDTWLPEQVSFMAATGNATANAYWEAKLAAGQKPHYESTDLEPFIRRKYCHQEYAEGTWPPASAAAAAPPATAVGRNGLGSTATPVSGPTAQSAQHAQHAASAGRLEAGGFWGSLSAQESGTGRDWAPEQDHAGTTDSPALLIDLMDFGADSTFQLPTTPRRSTSSSAQHFSDSPAHMHARGPAVLPFSNQTASSQSTLAPAVPAVAQQRSNFPLLPPPPQVTRQLGPPPQAPAAVPAPSPQTQAPAMHSSPSKDMAVNTDADLKALEGLSLHADMADPFSQSLHSSLDLYSLPSGILNQPEHVQVAPQHQLPAAGGPDTNSNHPQQYQQQAHSQQQPYSQQQQPRPQQQQPSSTPQGAPYHAQQAQHAGHIQTPSQPQPIFFQGQWFTPAPVDFVPPPHLTPPSQTAPHNPQQSLQSQQWQHPQQLQQVAESQHWQHAQQQPQHLWQQPEQPGSAHSYIQPQASHSGTWSPTEGGAFESPTFRDGTVKQLSAGPSGRTWSSSTSDVTRLTLPSFQASAAPAKDSIAVLDDLLLDALEGLQMQAQLDTGVKNKAARPLAMKEQVRTSDKGDSGVVRQVQLHSDASSSFAL